MSRGRSFFFRPKSAEQPDATTMELATHRIIEWQKNPYEQPDNQQLAERFSKEARTTRPTPLILYIDSRPSLSDLYEAVNLQRIRLQHDQQIPEW